jgi:hypothetical protein
VLSDFLCRCASDAFDCIGISRQSEVACSRHCTRRFISLFRNNRDSAAAQFKWSWRRNTRSCSISDVAFPLQAKEVSARAGVCQCTT